MEINPVFPSVVDDIYSRQGDHRRLHVFHFALFSHLMRYARLGDRILAKYSSL